MYEGRMIAKRKEKWSAVKELTIEMSDGFSLFAFIEKPIGKPVGHIHLLHGMAEHSGRYEVAVRFFTSHGYIVSGHDHRGHGKTAKLNGTKGHFANQDGFQRVVDDVLEVTSCLRQDNPALKFILLGHSMGSFIARRFIQLYGNDVDLAIFSGTSDAAGLSRYGGQATGYIAGRRKGFLTPNNFLFNRVFGGFNKGIKNPLTAFDWLSYDLKLVVSYMTDDNCGFIPTTQFFMDLFHGLDVIHRKSELLKIPKSLPILLFSGIEDPVGANGKGVWKVARQYNQVGIEDVTVLLFENGRHELLNDTNRQEVIEGVLKWMEIR